MMDRNKATSSARGPKSKITQQLPDSFIALGAKTQTAARDDPKRTVPLPKSAVSLHGIPGSSKAPVDKLKREGSSSSLAAMPASKKLKVNMTGSRPGISSCNLLTMDKAAGSQSPGIEPWESLVVECDMNDLFENIVAQINQDNTEKAVGYLLGLIKSLKNQRSKPSKQAYSVFFLVGTCKPAIYMNQHVVSAMLGILRRDVNAGLKGLNKSNPHFHKIFLNLIAHAYSEIDNWPDMFVKLYVEDAVGDRVFVDSPVCKSFVDNIITAFNTKVPPASLLKSEIWSTTRETSSPLTVSGSEDDEVCSDERAIMESWTPKVYPRYTQSQEKVEQFVLEAIKDQLARRQQPETQTKNFVRFLSTACGLCEIRIIAVSRIETWLHNHKLMKSAQELLAYLCYNCSANSQRDLEVISQLSKLRLKNKPMLNYFNNCLREMVQFAPENLYPLLKYTIYNELSNARNANNLVVVGALFQVAPDPSADAFADICLELLLNKDDYLRSLRALLKEINRVLRHELDLHALVRSLLRERKDFSSNVHEHEFKERIFLSMVDLVCVCQLLYVSPQIRDAATQSKRDATILKQFQQQVSKIQKECVTWLHDSALKIFRPNPTDFIHALRKVLFLEQAEHYYKIDSWPGENERNLFLRLTSEVPLLQTTLIRVLLIGLSKEHPVSAPEVLDICDLLIKRAANLPQDCAPPLVIDKVDIIDFFFNLCFYNYPENITLPQGYVPPKLAISNLYWKSWLTLLILAAHNPLTIGSLSWNKYPILRMFMEMCITNQFTFPPPTSLEDDYSSREPQILTLEKHVILEFETHLAAASTKMQITEHTSLLLSQLMELNPTGEVRRPPQTILDQLQTLNDTHRLGHLLCRSRRPDFLLDIMSRQGGTAHMPWLAELVHNSEGALGHLPVQCLCEYLLSTTPTEKLTKHQQVLQHLRTVVNGADAQIACEVLEYLFRRLTADHAASRTQATKGLGLILAPTEDPEVCNENSTLWITNYITLFKHFSLIRPVLTQFLRQALQIETNPIRVSSYINFLALPDCAEPFVELNELITDLSSVVIERHSVASYVLPGENNVTLKNLLQIFYLYTQKAKENGEESYTIHQSYGNEYVIVSWATGEQCAMQPLVIHATIVLLTYGPLHDYEPFNLLLNSWFPENMEHPRAYNPDTSETTSYLPDWMKLRMIRSNVSRLVDAAIEKLEPPKLVLFIQSFGIPTSSISKLLHTLDKATILDSKLVVDSVLDKTYMIQLVEVQNKRGAIGGETFVKAIEMQMPVVADVNIKVDFNLKQDLPKLLKKSTRLSSKEDIIQDLNDLLNPHFQGDKNSIIISLVKIITNDTKFSDQVFSFIKSVPINFIVSMIDTFNSSATLFRLLFATKDSAKLNYAKQLVNLIERNHSTKAILSRYIRKHSNDKDEKMIEKVCKTRNEALFSAKTDRKVNMIMLKQESSAEKMGVFVDWLSAIELESASSDKYKFQMDLLFSKENYQFRPLMMSLLLQRASWKTLHGMMLCLHKDNVSNVCPVSALDFLTAMTKSPKLWQGRDKAIPKHNHIEDVLHLNKEQALVMVKYIIEEARLSSEKNWENKIEVRLPLLLKCIEDSAVFIVKTLLERSETDIYCCELLLIIYMSLPYAGQDEIQMKPDICKNVYKKAIPSVIDEISHYLLGALAAVCKCNNFTKRSRDLETCVRKLAATHPVLLLRQLPMLAGCLKGRVEYATNVFTSRGHFTLFKQVLGIMELLQPHIFEQRDILSNILDTYFLLIRYHGTHKDLQVLVSRVVTFVQNWMVKDFKGASAFLQKHGDMLK
nr:unnamed protein product [Callosobruchus analis]